MYISDEALSTCWALSKLTVKDLSRDQARTQHMIFVEFLEFICRVAHAALFQEPDKKRSKYAQASVESSETSDWLEEFVRPELSEGTDREDQIEEMKAREGSESSDSDFIPSKEHKD